MHQDNKIRNPHRPLDLLVDDILEVVLGDIGCHHEVDHNEGGTHISADYSLKNELKVRNKIITLLEPLQVTEEWIEEKAKEIHDKGYDVYPAIRSKTYWKDFIRSLVEEIIKKEGK